jgi:RNA polymerase sigma-70 factor (ECF subfamily)
MPEKDWLAERFEANRAHLGRVAYRLLGSRSEADDAVQEAWLRLARADTTGVDNLSGWLTTVVARVALDMLRSRKSRREAALDDESEGPALDPAHTDDAADPEQNLRLADSVGVALLIVLETLTPAERVAFVLHDMFDLPFDDISAIVGRSPEAARQLASRARRRVKGGNAEPDLDRQRRERIVAAFLAASREGDFAGLLAVLDPDVVLHADPVAVEASIAARERGAPAPDFAEEIRGAAAVAETFRGRARGARPVLVDGAPGLAWAPGGVPRAVFVMRISGERIAAIEIVADPDRISQLDVEFPKR